MNKQDLLMILGDIDAGLVVTLLAIQGGMNWKLAAISGIIVFLKALGSFLNKGNNANSGPTLL